MKTYINIVLSLLLWQTLYGGNGCFSTLRAYEISNEYVAVCRLADVAEEANNNGINNYLIVAILVEQIKGKIDKDTLHLQVGYPVSKRTITNLENKEFLVFFRQINSKVYYTDGCSLLPLDEKNCALYQRTKEIVEINQIDNQELKEDKLIDWSIRCLSDQTTTYHGLTELSHSGFLYRYNSKIQSDNKNQEESINKNQKKQLTDYFLNKKLFDYNEIVILHLIEKGNKQAIKNKLQEQLNLYDSSTHPWYREFNLMQEIARLTKNRRFQNLENKITRLGKGYKSDEVKELTLQFIESMNELSKSN